MKVGDKVKIIDDTLIGIITQIYPEGVYAPFTIIQVNYENGNAGQFTEEQLEVIS
jgi:hypothetical protein